MRLHLPVAPCPVVGLSLLVLTHRLRCVGRRRYELVGLGVAAILALPRWATDGRQSGARTGRSLTCSASPPDARGPRHRPPVPGSAGSPASPRRGGGRHRRARVQRYGRWPWSRELLARGVSRLHEAGRRGHRAGHHLHRRGPRLRRRGDAARRPRRSAARWGACPSTSRWRLHPGAREARGSRLRRRDAALGRALADAPEVVQGVIRLRQRRGAGLRRAAGRSPRPSSVPAC